MKAALNGHAFVTRYLIQHGANTSKSDKDGWTALHNAASRDHRDVASVLIVDGDAETNSRSKTGFTPLSACF